jgi:hypothetical protein
MRYFIDTEYIFTTDKRGGTIEPISIGIVAEDGRELYRVSLPALNRSDDAPPFVREHVWPVADRPGGNGVFDAGFVCPLESIAHDLRFFIGDDTPEWWGDYADFDYVVLSIIMGGFDNWPERWPMYVNDLQQEAIPSVQSEIPHNALADARAVRDAFNWSRQDVS